MKKKQVEPIQRYTEDSGRGLSAEQVKQRIAQGCVNVTKKKNGKSYTAIFLGNILTFFNLLGILVFLLMVAIGSFSNAFFFIVILANLLLGIVQEIRAKKSIEKLSLMSDPTVTVVRDAEKREIAVKEVVLDDIMVLETGRQIVADAIVQEGEIEVNEALLTGESEAIKKKKGDILLSGSFVVSGNCYARVEHVGAENYVETLSAQAKVYKKPKSELMRSINGIVKVLAIFIFPLAVGTFFTALRHFGGVGEATVSTILLGNVSRNIVSALERTAGSMIGMIPSGMVLLTSTALAVSVIRLAMKNALAQDLYCIEMLARVNVLCLDKTGTITDGTMSVEEVVQLNETDFDFDEVMANYCRATEGNNPSALAMQDKFGKKISLTETTVLPFSSERKLSAVSFKSVGTIVVGAPEFVMDLSEKEKKKIAAYTAKGKRVILVAHSRLSMSKDGALPKSLKATALLVLEDTVREDAAQIVSWFKENNVAVRVISGDNAQTVSVIAKKVGIDGAENYVSLEGMSDAEVISIATKYTVFGRVTPDQKALLIKTIKAAGNTVAMTGDGVNDILAMKQADCAVAIAAGSEAARSVAHLVLMDSKFSSMPEVVKEGRKVVNNIQNASSLFLMKTIMTVLVTIMMLIMQKLYPFEPANLYPIEFFIIGIPAFVLALRSNDKLIEGRFLNNTLIKAIPSGLALAASVAIVYLYAMVTGKLDAQQITTLATIAMTYAGFMSLVVLCYPYHILEIATLVMSAVTTTLCFMWSRIRNIMKLVAVTGHLKIVFISLAAAIVIILAPRLVKYICRRRKQKLTLQSVN